jgi:NAD(P)-dependent dehydrogenase (short-subunit alcohol dehydrogenase family)
MSSSAWLVKGKAVLVKGCSFDLSGRTVLVTGASSGLGKRFAAILAESGAQVVIAARRVALLEKLKQDIEAGGGRALAVAMDAADETSIKAAFDAAEAEFGSVDSVVANAGVNIPGSTLGLSVEDFDKIVAINIRGVFLTAREGARRMIAKGAPERGHGRVVIISSTTASVAPAGAGPYAMSKAAVTQLGRSMAKDWAVKGVNVNVIAPGYIRTELNELMWEHEVGRQLLASFPRKRVMDESVLDATLLYLCSDACAQVTGSVFTIDDGQTL